jgi:hypothetical protein
VAGKKNGGDAVGRSAALTRAFVRYQIWKNGRARPDYRPTYFDLTLWMEEGAPPAGQVDVNVLHKHLVVRR